MWRAAFIMQRDKTEPLSRGKCATASSKRNRVTLMHLLSELSKTQDIRPRFITTRRNISSGLFNLLIYRPTLIVTGHDTSNSQLLMKFHFSCLHINARVTLLYVYVVS